MPVFCPAVPSLIPLINACNSASGVLPYSATEADVENFFAPAGVTVDGVNVMRDRSTGEARGLRFGETKDNAVAQRVAPRGGGGAQQRR